MGTLVFANGKKYVNCKQLDLRATNTNFGKKIGSAAYGDVLTVISESNNWCEVRNTGGSSSRNCR